MFSRCSNGLVFVNESTCLCFPTSFVIPTTISASPRVEDYPNALNGLQIENSGNVTKIGAAVDASSATLKSAAEQKINLLLVHHGMFWPGLQPVAGPLRRQLKFAIENDIALYAAHLPLDLHPEVGNNVQLARSLGFEKSEPFLELKGQPIGRKVNASLRRDELVAKLEKSLGRLSSMHRCRPGRNAHDWYCHRRRRRRNSCRGARRYRHVHHRRSAALGCGCRRRTRRQSDNRRSITRPKLSASKRSPRICRTNSKFPGNLSIIPLVCSFFFFFVFFFFFLDRRYK